MGKEKKNKWSSPSLFTSPDSRKGKFRSEYEKPKTFNCAGESCIEDDFEKKEEKKKKAK